MLVFIILLFINSNFVNALDESSENRYINQLPEKEKKELLERVARRIIREVKSNEAIAGFESGEIPEEKLKMHSDYVGRLLREERENLNRRNINNETDLSNTNVTVESTTTPNDVDKNIETIKDFGITTEDTRSTTKIVSPINKTHDEIEGASLRNQDDDLSKEELKKKEKVKDFYNRQGSQGVNGPETDKTDNSDISKLIDLTLRSSTTHDDVKVDEDKTLGLLKNEKQDNISETSHVNETKTNDKKLFIDDKLLNNASAPVSIEITFIDNQEDDLKTDKPNLTDKIPVKVIYDDKTPESLALSNKKTIQNLSNTSTMLQSQELKTDEKTRYRKSFSDGVDDNVPEITQTLDNQTARKKRKSRSDTDSVEINEESYDNRSDIPKLPSINKQNVTNVTDINRPINKTTAVQRNNDRELTLKVITEDNNNTTSEVKTENTMSSINIDKLPLSIANVTKLNLVSKVEPFAEETETKLEEVLENITEKPEIQHTQIDNFDVDENETTSAVIVNTNNTGSTTEEIVQMRTQHISGYPEDSNEDLTTTIAPNGKNEYPRSYTELKNENITMTNESLKNFRSQDDINNSNSKISVDSNIQDNPKGRSNIDKNTLSDSVTENKEDDINLSKESKVNDLVKNGTTSETKSSSLTKEPSIKLLTSTPIVPLTTTENNTKKELYYAMELPVEIQNDSAVVAENKPVNVNMPKSKSIVNVEDTPKKPLRLGLRPEDDFKDINYYSNMLLTTKPTKNTYVVYEILPGQNPFIKKKRKEPLGFKPQLIPKSQQRSPVSYPKISLYEVPKRDMAKIVNAVQPSQIEQPNYAPVYNYAPEYAYYNPRNIYGPNADDENVKIIDERSNERDEEDFDKIFDYEINDSNSLYNVNKQKKKKSKLKRISEDYYYGFVGPDLNLRGHQYDESLVSRKRSKKSKRKKPESIELKEKLKVLPNSDEYEHPRNAMFQKRPPITHNRQVQAILANIGYFGYNHNHLHESKNKNESPFEDSVNASSETWIGPHKYRNDAKKKIFLRSGGEDSENIKHSFAKRLVTMTISNRLRKKLKDIIENKNKTFNLNYENRPPNYRQHRLKRTREHKKHLFLLTGSPKNDYNKRKKPMPISTGRPIENDWKDNYYIKKPKNTGIFFKNRYVLGQESSENYLKNDNAYSNGYEDNEDFDGKIARDGSEEDLYHDPSDTSSGENDTLDTLPTLNMEAVKWILNASQKQLGSTSDLLDNLKKQKVLYLPPKNPTVKEYDHILKDHDSNLIYVLRSEEKELEAYITVIIDMINMDQNYALENYDWLKSTVDIRSAMKKLIMLNRVINERSRLYPKDLQLIKYILYLYSTTKYLLEPEKSVDKNNAVKDSDEYPKNKRFTYKEKESADPTKNKRFSVKNREYIPLQKSIHFTRRKLKPITQRPWMNKDGLEERMAELISFIKELADLLNDLHDAIKHISFIMKYDSQTWFKNLKELYLTPSRKTALEVLLHLEVARLIQMIEESAVKGLDKNYVAYSMKNLEEVERTKEEFGRVIKFYLELKKLQ